VALIGPNGAGKSTLFNCLSGVLRPDEGSVVFDGVDLLGLPSHRRSRLGIARTFQQIELFPGLTVLDHLLVAARAQRRNGGWWRDLAGMSRPTAEEKEQCESVLELVGLADDARRPVEALSLGRARVVELGRALVCNPSLLFLDEPSSGLDADETEAMGDVLDLVRDRREVSVLLCEHDVNFVRRLASRTVVLDCGARLAEGPTAQVLAQPDVQLAYLGAVA
jgi:branched-chain amino acid transport system ATP-binding protein